MDNFAEALIEDPSSTDVMDVVKFYQKNPVQAACDIFGFKFGLPWHQRLALKAAWELPDVIQVWTRGGGKTFFLAMFAGLSAILFPEEKVGIFGPSYRQAKFVWAELERLYDKSPIFKELTVKKPIMSNENCHIKFLKGSIIEALPLGDGSKIRGARYFRILGDEAAQIPEDVLDIVIGGMRATTKDPMEAVEAMRLQREMIKKGEMDITELIEPPKNKLLLTSTAYYRFNHLWDRVCLFKHEINKHKDKHPIIKVPEKIMWNDERALLMFDCDDPPEGFMNMKSVEENR